MPVFAKPSFSYPYQVNAQIQALRTYRDTKEGRAIPAKSASRLLLASWNIANLGAQERRDKDHRLIAEMISWFDLVAIQEVKDDLTGLWAVASHLPNSWSTIFSDKAGNDERAAFLFDSSKVRLLSKVGEVAVPPRWKYIIKVPGSTQKFDGFDRNPYLAGFTSGNVTIVAVNVHLYFGKDTAFHKNRRFMEALAVARWADLRRKSDYAFSKNIIVLGDFNLEKVGWDDPMWVVLGERGLHLARHSTTFEGPTSEMTGLTTNSPSSPVRRKTGSRNPECSTLMEQYSGRCGRPDLRRTLRLPLVLPLRPPDPVGVLRRQLNSEVALPVDQQP